MELSITAIAVSAVSSTIGNRYRGEIPRASSRKLSIEMLRSPAFLAQVLSIEPSINLSFFIRNTLILGVINEQDAGSVRLRPALDTAMARKHTPKTRQSVFARNVLSPFS